MPTGMKCTRSAGRPSVIDQDAPLVLGHRVDRVGGEERAMQRPDERAVLRAQSAHRWRRASAGCARRGAALPADGRCPRPIRGRAGCRTARRARGRGARGRRAARARRGGCCDDGDARHPAGACAIQRSVPGAMRPLPADAMDNGAVNDSMMRVDHRRRLRVVGQRAHGVTVLGQGARQDGLRKRREARDEPEGRHEINAHRAPPRRPR